MTTVVGVDHSIARTGLAIIRSIDAAPELFSVASTGKDTDSRKARGRRMREMRDAIMDQVPRNTTLAAIEGFAFSKNWPGQDRIHHLWWLLSDAFDLLRIPLAVIPPNTLKKFVTDDGSADKSKMRVGLSVMWPGLRIPNHDTGDGLAAATACAQHLGMPMPYLVRERHRLALAKVEWP
ncbi:hypothetical protein [Nocardia abscessus]|uniref:hypothetical protein n=1 Tax=Nocardia abscessus TaxID=120957 RepID=UPI002456AE29|nr:hypothetical protein [Nocardia abscessus]